MSAVKSIDEALDKYMKENGGPDVFTTGWIAVTSVSSPSHEIGNQDGYVTVTSDGLPHHVAVGLLHTALDDKKSAMMVSALHNFFYSIGEEEEDD